MPLPGWFCSLSAGIRKQIHEKKLCDAKFRRFDKPSLRYSKGERQNQLTVRLESMKLPSRSSSRRSRFSSATFRIASPVKSEAILASAG